MESIFLKTEDGIELEGIYHAGQTDRAAVITHPHPLFGGDMNNPVVEAVEHVCQESGCSTVRFNFRGVGKSSGRYAEGKGEQQDVLAAMAFLKAAGGRQILLAGYSFGAWVNAHVAAHTTAGGEAQSLIMVSPPVGLMDFADTGRLAALDLVVTGSADDIAAPAQIKPLMAEWNPAARLEVIEDADHFYGGALAELTEILRQYL